MPTYAMRPSGQNPTSDVAFASNIGGSESSYWAYLADPAFHNGGSFDSNRLIGQQFSNSYLRLFLSDISVPANETITSVTVWQHTSYSGAGGSAPVHADLYHPNGTHIARSSAHGNSAYGGTWFGAPWNASPSAADCNGMYVDLRIDSPGGQQHNIHAVYVEVITVVNAPANTSAPTIVVNGSRPAKARETLSVSSNGGWTNTPTGYTYQWQRNGANIAGATGSSYTTTSTDANTTVRCVVTASNAGGSSAGAASAGIYLSIENAIRSII